MLVLFQLRFLFHFFHKNSPLYQLKTVKPYTNKTIRNPIQEPKITSAQVFFLLSILFSNTISANIADSTNINKSLVLAPIAVKMPNAIAD